mmetsp:Transcript_3684/g.6610  ORF Transcript_3684/g.6610 Transcript_3684/m.6610 type:complete len:210 (+) Transcript_3684:465-1094(+)
MNTAFVAGTGVAFSSKTASAVCTKAVARKATVTMMAKSRSMPFMEKPANLPSDIPGGADFDPFGFTNWFDVKWMQEAEIKHGRVCMLAALGLIIPEFFTFPFYAGAPTLADPAHAFFVKQGALQQVLLFVCFWEIIAGVPACIQMYRGADRQPGQFYFDPLGIGKANYARFQTSEIKNGRLAMIAVGGIIHEQWLSHEGVIAHLQHLGK